MIKSKDVAKVLTNIFHFLKFAMKSYVFKLKLKIQSVSDGRTGIPTLYKKNFYQMLCL